MKKWSKILSVFLALMLAINLLPVHGAEGIVYAAPLERPRLMASPEPVVLPTELRETLSSQFAACKQVVDIEKYNLTFNEAVGEALSNLIYYEMAESFHVVDISIGYYTSTRLIANLTVEYGCTASEYKTYLAQCKAVSEELLAGIKGNAALTDVEKALLVHDRLILHCEYDHWYNVTDTKLLEAFSMYGALVEKRAVCQGYTAAYDYLMEQLGIKSRFCISDSLEHCWNIITVGNKEYHVDVTWDDPTICEWNFKGEVLHDHFLNSTARCAALHETADFEQIPNNTEYDDAFWVNSYTAFILLNGEIYYVDNVAQQLRTCDQQVLASVADEWDSFDINLVRLGTFNGYLYLNSAETIYEVDPMCFEAEEILAPELVGGQQIYGFAVENGVMVYDLSADLHTELPSVVRRTAPILPYVDLGAGAWYLAGVHYAYRQGLMNGMTATTFAPETTMSRAMLVTVLYRLSDAPQVSGESPFNDVKDNQWFADAVKWAAQNGIVNGITPTTFEPNAPVNRAQLVTILYRYAQMRGYDTTAEDDLSGFADRTAAPAWAKDAMEWAVAEGIVNGMAEGNKTYLRYYNSTTRAQVATVLMRYLRG